MKKIVIFLFIIILFFIVYIINKNIKKKNTEPFNINQLEIIKRSPEKQKLIEKILKEKKEIFTDEEIKALENKFQFYDLNNNKIMNITDEILKKENDKKTNNYQNIDENNNITIEGNIYTNPAYNDILNNLNDKNKISCQNIGVLKNPLYLKNYYYDMYGNKIKSSLKDYINDYYTRIDNDDNEGQKVEIIKGKNNFIIPDQYKKLKYLTNAYNIDWSRIINPLTVY